MSIIISKRTRTLVNNIYSNWSNWSTTTDTPPYSNTDTVQYKVGNIDFQDPYLSSFSSLMNTAIGSDTPYSKTLEYLTEEFNDDNLTPKEKANLKAQVMANITTSITNNAMQIALGVTEKQIKLVYEVEGLQNKLSQALINLEILQETKQNKINQAEYQAENIKQSYLFTQEKIQQLIKAAKDNNRIQATQIIGEFFEQYKIGGGTLSSEMFQLIFEMAIQTYNNTDSSISMTSNLSTT